MAQLNVEIDDNLLKRVKIARIEDKTSLKKWVSTALEIALEFDNLAMARCTELGWLPPQPIEIIDEPTPSEPKRIKKT